VGNQAPGQAPSRWPSSRRCGWPATLPVESSECAGLGAEGAGGLLGSQGIWTGRAW